MGVFVCMLYQTHLVSPQNLPALATLCTLGDCCDVAWDNTDVLKLVAGKTAQLIACVTNVVPGTDCADDVHFSVPQCNASFELDLTGRLI